MSALAIQRTSAHKAGWVVVALLVTWLVFLFFPFRHEKKSGDAGLPPIPAQSRLQSVGLSNNVDWEGLPQFFAVWSDQAPWQADQVQFAYWHPGAKAYTYYFEATRRNGVTRFRALSAAEALAGRDFFEDGTYVRHAANAGEARTDPVFAETSATHPFVFFREMAPLAPLPVAVAPGEARP